jgi:iron complex transport system substrate-binding protein
MECPFVFSPDASRRCTLIAVFLACACGRTPQPAGRTIVDDAGDSVRVGPAGRIVSLNPVATELLFASGAGPRVVGRTHWDTYPAEAASAPDLGNGIEPNVEAVVGAKPDLVVLYLSASNRKAAAALHQAGIRTLTMRTDGIADLRRMAERFYAVTGDSGAIITADTVMQSVEAVRALPRPARPPRAFWMLYDAATQAWTMGRASYMHELLVIAGAENAFGDIAEPSAQVSVEEVVRRNPDVIIAGPRTARQLRDSAPWRLVPAVHDGRIAVVDTAFVSRPGVRLGEAARHIRALIVDSARRAP